MPCTLVIASAVTPWNCIGRPLAACLACVTQPSAAAAQCACPLQLCIPPPPPLPSRYTHPARCMDTPVKEYHATHIHSFGKINDKKTFATQLSMEPNVDCQQTPVYVHTHRCSGMQPYKHLNKRDSKINRSKNKRTNK